MSVLLPSDTLDQIRTMMENQRREMTNHYQAIIRGQGADIARLTEESSRRLREQQDLRSIIRDNASSFNELRRVVHAYYDRYGDINLDGNTGTVQTLERIESLVHRNIINNEPPLRVSLIKYTSAAYWVFSLYDSVSRYSHLLHQFLKTHLIGVRWLHVQYHR
jgi:hypothetical protein